MFLAENCAPKQWKDSIGLNCESYLTLGWCKYSGLSKYANNGYNGDDCSQCGCVVKGETNVLDSCKLWFMTRVVQAVTLHFKEAKNNQKMSKMWF